MGIATKETQEKWVEENIERGAKREPQAVEFTVYDCTDSTAVGTAGLLGIGHANGTAEKALHTPMTPRASPGRSACVSREARASGDVRVCRWGIDDRDSWPPHLGRYRACAVRQ